MKHLIIQALPDNPVNLGFLLLFVLTFVAVVATVVRPQDPKRLERESRLPFED